MKTEKYRKMFSGENSSLWRGGISRERTERCWEEYRVWRASVFHRDHYTCKRCNQHGGNVEAHHIFNFRDNRDLIFDVENGVTLCKKCHCEFHKIYGKRFNTEEQLETFLTNKDE